MILSVISLLFIAFIHLALICWTKCFVPCISLSHQSTHITSGLLGSLGQLNIACCRFFIVDHAVRFFFLFKLHQLEFEQLGMRHIDIAIVQGSCWIAECWARVLDWCPACLLSDRGWHVLDSSQHIMTWLCSRRFCSIGKGHILHVSWPCITPWIQPVTRTHTVSMSWAVYISVHWGDTSRCLGVGGWVWFVYLLALRGKTAHGGGNGSRTPRERS
jgi:hypothetical protein